MILKTTAIVLRYAPFSNTSRMVSWFSEEYGRITTVVKGSQRPKSAFLGQYDLFYTCELLFYAREHNHAHIIRECSPLKPRTAFRRDWKACAAASYLADLILRICPISIPQPEVYVLLETLLDHLALHGADEAALFWFELKLLHHLGFAPRLERCMECKCDLDPSPPKTGFSYARGGILCPACARESRSSSPHIEPDILGMMRGWQRAPTLQSALAIRHNPRQTQRTADLLGVFLSYHLDTPNDSRPIALEILKT